jgi:hypothetical protein
MTRIFTPPDLDFNRSIPRVFIRNCSWTVTQLYELVPLLGDKNYDIYIYHDSMNDVQWAEGIRTSSTKVYDWSLYAHMKPEDFLRSIDNDF